MTNTAQFKDEVVTAVKDNGRSMQWGINKFFMKWDGPKRRLNSKAALSAVAALFVMVAIIGIIGHEESSQKPGSDIESQVPTSSLQEIISVPPLATATDLNERRSNQKNSGASANRSARLNSLAIVRRNPGPLIPPGSTVKSELLSGASNGFIKARTLENLMVDGDVMIPSGTIVVGSATSSKERLKISFTMLVHSDGGTTEIDGQACDNSDGMPGLKGVNVRSHTLSLVGASMLNFAGGIALGLQHREQKHAGSPPKMKDALLNGSALASVERAKDISNEVKSLEPLIEVERGTKFNLLFLGSK